MRTTVWRRTWRSHWFGDERDAAGDAEGPGEMEAARHREKVHAGWSAVVGVGKTEPRAWEVGDVS